MIELLDLDRVALCEVLEQRFAERSFRATQLMKWLHQRRATDFECMTDISRSLREQFRECFSIYRPVVSKVEESVDGSRKYLFGLKDDSVIESVLIKQPNRLTLCVSSQVGCAIGCKFCLTGTMGLRRNLLTHEIVGQVLAVMDDIAQVSNGEAEIRNIVFMGMGEPLHNFDNVYSAVRVLGDEMGLDFSARKITISTSGVVSGIKKIAENDVRANLAVSLNATTDEVRSEIMPLNKKWPIDVLLQSLRDFPLRRRQRITIGYVLLRGVNDTDEDLERLPKLLKGINVKVNLISYNTIADFGYEPSEPKCLEYWCEKLLGKGVNTTIRWSKGEDISAACGQLATMREG